MTKIIEQTLTGLKAEQLFFNSLWLSEEVRTPRIKEACTDL